MTETIAHEGVSAQWTESEKKQWLETPKAQEQMQRAIKTVTAALVQANLTDWISYDGTVAKPWQQVAAAHPIIYSEDNLSPAYHAAVVRFCKLISDASPGACSNSGESVGLGRAVPIFFF